MPSPGRNAGTVIHPPGLAGQPQRGNNLMTTSSASILLQYEIIADLSGKMLQHAQSCDWDGVIALGKLYHDAVEQLRTLAPLDQSDRDARKSLLTKILDDDARIRDLATPELARLGALLGNMRRHQAVLETYCAPARTER